MMGVFNNLVMFDQHLRQNSLEGVVPDLAEKWTWSEDDKKLTFALDKVGLGTTASPSLQLSSLTAGAWRMFG